MVDLHSHVLPNMDDGSSSPEESAQLLRLSRQHGVTVMAATPHFYAAKEDPAQFMQRRQEAYARITYDEQTMPRLLLGAEVAYFNGMSGCEDLVQMQIGNSGMLLVEMPFVSWSDRMIKDITALRSQLGLQPVLAHVERYGTSDQFFRYREQLLAEGVFFQCNADAFFPMFSKYVKLLRNGQIHFLGSDCHNMTVRAPKLDRAAAIISKKIAPEILEDLEAFALDVLL